MHSQLSQLGQPSQLSVILINFLALLVDKVILLDDSSIPVIQDTLAILTSKEIKLSSLRRYMNNHVHSALSART